MPHRRLRLTYAAAAAALLLALHALPSRAQGSVPAAPAPGADSSVGKPITPEEDSKTRASLEAAIAANRTLPEPYIVLSAFKASRGDLAGALATLNDGIAAVPGASELRVVLGRLYLLQKRYDEAIAAFQKAIELDPKAVAPRLELADEYRGQLHQPEKALDLYREALAIDTHNTPAQFGVGEALADLGRRDEAIAALTAAQKLAPRSAPISLAVGRLYGATGRLKEALAAIDTALKLQPGYIDARIERGRVLYAMGNLDDAKKEYEVALGSDKKSVPAKVGIALIYQAAGQTGAAEGTFLEVLDLDKDNLVALNSLAWMAAEQKRDLDQALTWATRAASLAKNQPDVLDTLGWVLRQRGDLQRAADVLESALKLRQSPEYYMHLGVVRADLGNKEQAAAAFNAALKLAPDYGPAKEALGKLH